MKKQRCSNLELLRVIAMMMVISLHQNGAINALTGSNSGEMKYYLSHMMESVSICSVNCFVLLSGYFMVDKKEAPVKKCVHLLVDVAFWGLLGCGCTFLICGKAVEINELITAIVPYIKGQRWFVRDYIILMLLAPFINTCLKRLSKREYQLLLILLLLIFSVWPSFFPNPPIDDYGFSCVHFILLYAIAGYLKLHLDKTPKKAVCAVCYLVSVVLIFFSAIIGNGYAYAYNYLFVITAAVSLFLFFRGLMIQSATLNCLAAGVFDVFVIHTTGFFADLVYLQIFHGDTALVGSDFSFLINMVLCPPTFYLLCIVLAELKSWVFRMTVDRWLERIPVLNLRVE